MPRTLDPALSAAMDSGVFTPYFNVQIIDSDRSTVLFETTEIINFSIEGLSASISFHNPAANEIEYTFKIQRGILVEGVPNIISTSNLCPTRQRFHHEIHTVDGFIFPDEYFTTPGDVTYQAIITTVCAEYGFNPVFADPAAAWLNYQFLPVGEYLTLHSAGDFFNILRQKYLIFATDYGSDQLYFFHAHSTLPANYTVLSNNITTPLGSLQKRTLVSHDENGTIHESGTTGYPIHDLGFLPSTAAHPVRTTTYHTPDWLITNIPPHLKYLNFDDIEASDGILLPSIWPAVIRETYNSRQSPAWQWQARYLDIFNNATGGTPPDVAPGVVPDSYAVYADLSGWVDITADIVSDIAASWGLPGTGPTSLLAATGWLKFTLNNNTGQYSPGRSTALAGWKKGTLIKLVIVYLGETYVRFRGTVSTINIKPAKTTSGSRAEISVHDWISQAISYPVLNPAIATDQRADEALDIIVPAMPIQPAAHSYEVGDSVFPAIFDNTTLYTKAYSEFLKLALSEVGYIYLKKDKTYGETLVFENNHYRHGLRTRSGVPFVAVETYLLLETDDFLLLETGDQLILDEPPSGTIPIEIDNDMSSLAISYGAGMVNNMTLTVHPKRVDSVEAILYSLNSPLLIGPGVTLTIRGAYTDPIGGAKVNAFSSSMVDPVATDDYLFNSAHDGTGDDMTGDLTIVALYGTESVSYTLTNTATASGYVTFLQARGYAIYRYNPVETTIQDTDSIAEFGYQTGALDQPYQRDFSTGMIDAAKILNREKQPRLKLNEISMNANDSSALMLAFLNIDIGDLAGIVNDLNEIDSWYFIQKIAFTLHQDQYLTFNWTTRQHFSLLNGGLTLIYTYDNTGQVDFSLPHLANLTQKSYSAWITFTPNGAAEIIGNRAAGGSGNSLALEGNTKVTYFDGGLTDYGYWITTNAIATPTFHIVCTRNNGTVGDAPIIYINGAAVELTNLNVQVGHSNETGLPFRIAQALKGSTDIRCYNRILSADEALTLYTEGPGGTGVTDGLIFQAPCVPTAELDDYIGATLTADTKVMDNLYGIIGTPTATVHTCQHYYDNLNSTSIATIPDGGEISWTHTTNIRNNRLLLVGVSCRTLQTVTSVTYNGVSLTRAGYTNWAAGDNPHAEIWYLVAPASGANTVVVQMSGVENTGAYAMDFYDINQASPLGTSVSATGTSTAPSVTASNTANDILIDLLTTMTGTVTAGTGQASLFTSVWNNPKRGSSSTKSNAALGTMAWTVSESTKWALLTIPLKRA